MILKLFRRALRNAEQKIKDRKKDLDCNNNIMRAKKKKVETLEDLIEYAKGALEGVTDEEAR